jgi:hypothetical protein
MFILSVFKNYVFNNCFQVKDATSPYNLQNYKKIFIYALNKQELRKFFQKSKTIYIASPLPQPLSSNLFFSYKKLAL